MNLWEILNSPKYWDKPDEFNPYRFLSEDRRSVVNHLAFIPFGIGRRKCSFIHCRYHIEDKNNPPFYMFIYLFIHL